MLSTIQGATDGHAALLRLTSAAPPMIDGMLSAAIFAQAARTVPTIVEQTSGDGASAWLIALAAGAIGAVFTALFTVAARALAARGDVVAHDAQATQMNRQLEAWVDDRNRKLLEELSAVTNDHNARGLFNSSIHGAAAAEVKTQALHDYRDQRWRTELTLEGLGAAEAAWHRHWRRRLDVVGGLALPAADRVEPVLDRWRAPITRHGADMPVAPFDPTRRTLDDLLAELEGQQLT